MLTSRKSEKTWASQGVAHRSQFNYLAVNRNNLYKQYANAVVF